MLDSEMNVGTQLEKKPIMEHQKIERPILTIASRQALESCKRGNILSMAYSKQHAFQYSYLLLFCRPTISEIMSVYRWQNLSIAYSTVLLYTIQAYTWSPWSFLSPRIIFSVP